jgi:hypothetical protein
MMFLSWDEIDDAWITIENSLKLGKLGCGAKVSTARPNPNAFNPNEGVIIIYTYDYEDQEDVFRVAETIRELVHYPKTIYYKTDQQTLSGAYAKYGKKSHIYEHSYTPSAKTKNSKSAPIVETVDLT